MKKFRICFTKYTHNILGITNRDVLSIIPQTDECEIVEAEEAFIVVNPFNENLLNEIIRLRKTAEIAGLTPRISSQLEALRYVRNTTLNLTFEEGLEEENNWWQQCEKKRKTELGEYEE